MRRGRAPAAVAIATLSAALACVHLQGKIDYQKDVDFTTYRTFFVERARPLDATGSRVDDDGELARRLEEVAQFRLEERLREKDLEPASAEQADLHVGYYLTARDEVHMSDRPGHERWLRVETRDIVYDSYTRGTLVIDFSDRERNLLVWHGAVEGVVKSSRISPDGRNVLRAVDRLMRQYPPRPR